MRKSTRIVKRLLALFLVVLMSIESIGAIVSDNDGSAFITKAEFDSLKNNFQSQIDQYNTSIDSKIDGAIASYLAGVNISKKSMLTNLMPSFEAVDRYSIYFTDKATAFNDTNNNSFTRGGWWLFWVYGWNTAATGAANNAPNGIINVTNDQLNDHRLNSKPNTVSSYKYWLKSVTVEGSTYYGPYNSEVSNIIQELAAQRIISTWYNAKDSWHWKWDIRSDDATFDFTSLSAPGVTNLGSWNSGWQNFDNIQGTLIVNYLSPNFNNRWHVLNAAGVSNDTGTNYCIDVDKKFDLTEEQSESSRFIGGAPGMQYQEFNARAGTGNSDGTGTVAGHPIFTFKFNTPKILQVKSADLVNWVTSQSLNQIVPQYAGLPIASLPGKGKIKFKYSINHFNLVSGGQVAGHSKVAFKCKQFTNNTIDNENQSDLLFVNDDCSNAVEYTAEFDIEDAKNDGSSYLYVKVAPTSNDVYARINIIGDIEYTEEN